MQKPSVLLVNQSFYPDEAATGQIFSDLAVHLQSNGFRVTALAARTSYNEKNKSYSKHDSWNGINIRRTGRFKPKTGGLVARLVKFTSQAASFFWTYFTTRRHSITIIGTSPPLLVLFIYFLSILKRSKLIVWNMDSFPEAAVAGGLIRTQSVTYKFLLWLRNSVYNHCSAIVAIDESMSRHLIINGIKKSNITKIQVWHPKLTPQLQRDYRSEWGLQDSYIILYSGNLGVAHDELAIFELIEHFKHNKKIKFVIVGGGSGNKKLKERISKSSSTNTFFYQHQPFENLQSLIEMADTHIVTLKREFVGIVYPSKIYGIAERGRQGILLCPEKIEVPKNIHQLNNRDAQDFIKNDFYKRKIESSPKNDSSNHRLQCLDSWIALCNSALQTPSSTTIDQIECDSVDSLPNAS